MATKKGIEAGGAYVRIFADDSPLRRTLKSAGEQIAKFSRPFVAAGAKIAGAMLTAGAAAVTATKLFANYGDTIGDAAARIGLSAETLSELGYAAKLSGSSLEDLEKGFRTFQKGLITGSNKNVLARLGLSSEALAAMSPDAQLNAIINAMRGIADPTMRAAMAMQLFGKAGANLVPLLGASAEEMAAMREEAKRLGVSLTAEQVAAAGAFNDALDKMAFALKGISTQIGAALAPAMTYLAERVLEVAASFVQWLSDVMKFVGSFQTAMATIDLAWAATMQTFGDLWDTAKAKFYTGVMATEMFLTDTFDAISVTLQNTWASAMQAMRNLTFSFIKSISKPLENALKAVGLETAATYVQVAGNAASIAQGLATDDKTTAENDKRNAELEKRRKKRALEFGQFATQQERERLDAEKKRAAEVEAATKKLQESMGQDDEQRKRAASDAAQKAAKAAMDAEKATGGGFETAGTFAAAAISGLGAQSLQADMLAAMQQVATNTDAMVNEIAAGGVQ